MIKYNSSILACSCCYLDMKFFGIKNYNFFRLSNEISSQKIIK